MSNPLKILAFAGSARLDSYNKRLVKIAGRGAEQAGAEVTFLDLLALPMPLFNEDLEAEEGLPDTARQFKALLKGHQGFLIASPEYNGSISGLLKNAIDWASRPDPDNIASAADCFRNKVVVLMATSPGGLGGLRGLVHVRSILTNLGAIVLPEQRAIPHASQAFDATGQLIDPKQQSAIRELGARVVAIATALSAP
jgi:NAD(P)H-dependent FMN reductase